MLPFDFVGKTLGAATITAWGTEEQKQFYLYGLATCCAGDGDRGHSRLRERQCGCPANATLCSGDGSPPFLLRDGHGHGGEMKYRPDDAELLDAIAALLEEEVMAAVGPALQHRVRVAANLARILQRQQLLEPAALVKERGLLAAVLGYDGDVRDLRAELDRRLRERDPGLDGPQAWQALVNIARNDLAMAKPGYDSWEGG